MPKKPEVSNLSFQVRPKPSPGCRYIVVQWKVGSGAKRLVVSCHRERSAARTQLAKVKGMYARDVKGFIRQGVGRRGAKLMFGEKRFGIYDLTTGKKVA